MNVTEVKNEEKELEINISGMCKAILKKIWIVILAAVILGAGSFLYLKKTYVPEYKTTVGIYIIGNEQSPASGTAVQIATNIAKDYELLIKDPVVLDKVSAAVKEKGIETDVKELSKKISVESPENTRILLITVSWESSESVEIIANAVRDAAIEELPKITKVPANPISDAQKGALVDPNMIRKTVLIAFLGACIAAFAIAVIFVLDDKLSSKKDIENRLGLSVLGVIPNVTKSKKSGDEYRYYGKNKQDAE